MAINFPSSPSEGQKFINGAVAYTFAGGVWNASPLETALPFNYIVNPAMQVSQQNARVAGNTNGYYPADQWMLQFGGWPTVDANSQPATGIFFPFALSMGAPLRASLGVTDLAMFTHVIEGNRIADLQWGTAFAKSIVIRFASNAAPAGNYAFAVRNVPPTRSYVISFALTGAQQEFSFSIPGCADGTWATGNTPGLSIIFCGATGTTYQAPAINAWQTGNYIGFAGLNNAAAGAMTLNVTKVGLYLDPLGTGRAPPFEPPSERQVMQDCLRYWYPLRHGRGNVNATNSGHRNGTRHPVPMRIAPAFAIVGTTSVIYDIGSAPVITGITAAGSDAEVAENNLTAASGAMTVGRASIYTSTNATNYIAVSARM